MKKLVALVAVVALAGCATGPQQTPEQMLAGASNVDLCTVVMYAPRDVSELAGQEAARRSINCQDYAQAAMQQQQARAQAAAARRQPIVIPPLTYRPPAPTPLPHTTTCTTQRFGNQLETVCR